MSDKFWRWARVAAVAAYACVQAVLGFQDSPASDEVRHLRDGAHILESGRVDVNPEHPPLLKLVSALAIPAGQRHAGLQAATGDPLTADARFAVSLRLLGSRLLRPRIPPILIATLGLFAFGALFARVSQKAAFVATAALGASPPFLAHGHYITTDVAPVSFFLLALLALISLDSHWGALLSGTLAGAAIASKFSAPLIFPFFALYCLFSRKLRDAALVILAAFVFAFGIEAYAVRNMATGDVLRLAEKAFVGGGLGGPAPPSAELTQAAHAVAGGSRALGAYWIGFSDVAHRSSTSQSADYWMGRIVSGPEPLYPLVTLAFKIDLPLLTLSLVAAIALLKGREWRLSRDAWVCTAAGVLYLALASRSSLHLGIRHLLPLVVLVAALPAFAVAANGRRFRILLWPLLALHIAVASFDYPFFAFSRNVASRLFLASDAAYDLSDNWGQDLGRFLRHRPGPVYYAAVTHYRTPEWAGLFPGLQERNEPGSLVLVDRIALDILDAAGRSDVPQSARPILASLGPRLEEIDFIRTHGETMAIPEPSLRLFELRWPPAR